MLKTCQFKIHCKGDSHSCKTANDIILIAQSVSELRNLLRACDKELITIDMKINVQKSCCMRVRPRCNANCANLQTSDGRFTMGL